MRLSAKIAIFTLGAKVAYIYPLGAKISS